MMADVPDVIERIRASGERMTIPRRLVIEALGHSHHHLTIADIQQHMRDCGQDEGLSDTTIYRVLQWLKDLELVSQTDMGKGGVVYALISMPYHHHLICLSCGATQTIDDDVLESLRQTIRRDYGFEARTDHMAIYGRCSKCLAG
jgi:Fur family ferric uptake transcriptional regulator